MEARSVFKRNFWLFENEDSGYELGQKPKGYIKTEERDGKGKLWLSVQNLRKTAGKYSYELKLLRAIGARFAAADMGRLEEGNNGYSLEIAFDAANVAGTGVRLQDFDTAVVLVRLEEKEAAKVICPLAAYKSAKTEWRIRASGGPRSSGKAAVKIADLKAADIKPVDIKAVENKAAPAVPSDYKKIESKYVPEESIPSLNINEKNREKFAGTIEMRGSEALMGIDAEQAVEFDRKIEIVQDGIDKRDIEINTAQFNELKNINEAEMAQPYEQSGQSRPTDSEIPADSDRSEDSEIPADSDRSEDSEIPADSDRSEDLERPIDSDRSEDPEIPADSDRSEDLERPVDLDGSEVLDKIDELSKTSRYNDSSSTENEPDYSRPKRPLDDGMKPQTAANPAFENVNTSCVYMNGSMCGGYMNDGVSNPCSGCRAYSNPPVQEKKDNGIGNIDKLKELLEANFEKCDPFNSNRSDYKWWKVANPVNLNNLLYECNIRSPLLFNPNVMMSHYKYRHLIIGVFTDRQTKKEYLVCGVPGMHMVDKRPFDDLCRWVQFEGSKPLYGAFGYWLVYIDPKTGRLISTR